MKKTGLSFGAIARRKSITLQCTDRNIWKFVSEAENKALDYDLSKEHGRISPYTFIVHGSPDEITAFQEFLNALAKEG